MNYAGALGGAAGLAGGLITSGMMGDAYKKASGQYDQGANYITDANNTQRQDYQPYMQAGQEAIGNYAGLLAQGSGAQDPTASQAFSYDAWTDPSTQYRIDQANQGINASALAKGSVGGGLAKALASNSQNMASAEYANAYDRYLKQNNQDFGQQQQLWNNATQTWQNQLAGQGNLMSTGLQATTGTANAAGNYANMYNQNRMGLGSLGMDTAANQAGAIAGGLKSGMSGISSLMGG